MNLTVSNYFGGTMNGFSTATINTRNTEFPKAVPLAQESQPKKSLNYNAKTNLLTAYPRHKVADCRRVLTRAKVQSIIYSTASEPGNMMTVRYRLPSHTQKRMVKCAQSKVSNLKQEENLQRKYEREKSAKRNAKRSPK